MKQGNGAAKRAARPSRRDPLASTRPMLSNSPQIPQAASLRRLSGADLPQDDAWRGGGGTGRRIRQPKPAIRVVQHASASWRAESARATAPGRHLAPPQPQPETKPRIGHRMQCPPATLRNLPGLPSRMPPPTHPHPPTPTHHHHHHHHHHLPLPPPARPPPPPTPTTTTTHPATPPPPPPHTHIHTPPHTHTTTTTTHHHPPTHPPTHTHQNCRCLPSPCTWRPTASLEQTCGGESSRQEED